jgi:predicted nucleic acid-binding protein
MVEDHQYYFDANALFKYYQDEKGDLNIRRLVANTQKPVLVSSLSLLECFNIVMRYRRKNLFKNRHVNRIFKQLKKDARFNATHHPFEIIAISDNIFPIAQNILFHHARSFQIGSMDALHLAIIQKLQLQTSPILVTSDKSMQQVCKQLAISFYDPEIN